MDRNFILGKLKDYLSEERYIHTLGVEETAIKMSKIFGVDAKKVSLAALLHDVAKELKIEELIEMANQEGLLINQWENKQPRELLHAPASAHLAAKDFGIRDKEVLQAITYHTLGNEDMTALDMIIFVADMVEVNRNYPGVEELRVIAFKDLREAVIACLDHTLKYLQSKGADIHPQTIKTFESLRNSDE